MAICAVLAIGGIVYSLNAGAGLVLRVSGAVPADPVQYQQLHDLVEALAIGDGIPKPDVYVIDDPSPNAFATGVSPDKAAITFTTGLLAIMNREELEGVASHEMSHIKNHDIRLLLVVGTMIGMAALLASILWRSAFFAGRGRDSGQIMIVIFAAGALLALVGFIFGPLMRLALSRRRESLADVSGVELTRNPAGLLSALKKLQQNDQPFRTMNHATAAMCIDDPLQHHDACTTTSTTPTLRSRSGSRNSRRSSRVSPSDRPASPVGRLSWLTAGPGSQRQAEAPRSRRQAGTLARPTPGQNRGKSPEGRRALPRRWRRTPPP
jgi:heat shock protein HtpX